MYFRLNIYLQKSIKKNENVVCSTAVIFFVGVVRVNSGKSLRLYSLGQVANFVTVVRAQNDIIACYGVEGKIDNH